MSLQLDGVGHWVALDIGWREHMWASFTFG